MMLSEHVRAIGALARTLVLRAARLETPPDLAALALEVAEVGGFLDVPADPEALQAAVRLAETLLTTLAELEAERTPTEEWPNGPMTDTTGPATVPKRRSRRFGAPRIFRQEVEKSVAGEDGDVVRVGLVHFTDGDAYISVMAHANRPGYRAACLMDSTAVRDLSDRLRERAEALEAHARRREAAGRRRERRWERGASRGKASPQCSPDLT